MTRSPSASSKSGRGGSFGSTGDAIAMSPIIKRKKGLITMDDCRR